MLAKAAGTASNLIPTYCCISASTVGLDVGARAVGAADEAALAEPVARLSVHAGAVCLLAAHLRVAAVAGAAVCEERGVEGVPRSRRDERAVSRGGGGGGGEQEKPHVFEDRLATRFATHQGTRWHLPKAHPFSAAAIQQKLSTTYVD